MAPPVSRAGIGESGRGISFSSKTKVAMAAIQNRFNTPPENKSSINTQAKGPILQPHPKRAPYSGAVFSP